MKKITLPQKLRLRKETVRVLADQAMRRAAGGMLPITYSRACCGDDSSGDGLLCPAFAPTTR